MPLHIGKGRTMGRAIKKILDYVKNPEKTDRARLVSAYRCNAGLADAEFMLLKQSYLQKTGRERGADDVIAYHLRQAFLPGEITPEEANRLGQELAMRFTGGNHAFIVCTHTDRAHIHNHIVFSAVNTGCDRKFRNFWGSSKALRRLNDMLCIENGYSVVAEPEQTGTDYGTWLGNRAALPHREQIRLLIDEILQQGPKDFEALLSLLRDAGLEVKGNPANPSLRGPAQKWFIRMDTLGQGYTPLDLQAVIAGTKRHFPRP